MLHGGFRLRVSVVESRVLEVTLKPRETRNRSGICGAGRGICYTRPDSMALSIKKNQRLPFFRLATLGGTSRSRDDFFGRPALYVGWASWDASRDALPSLQAFYEAHRDRVEVVTLAFDVQGPEVPMRYLRAAGFAFTALIDACCELSRLWGARAVPFSVLADAAGNARLIGGPPDADFLGSVSRALAAKAAPKPARDRRPARGPDPFEVLLQSCTNLLGRARKEEALFALQQALDLHPENHLVRPQMWAIAHPERFYSGEIDLAWQKEQRYATRTLKAAKKR